MKLQQKQNQSSILTQTSKSTVFYEGVGWAIGPNPATPEAIARAQFKDKTYIWQGR